MLLSTVSIAVNLFYAVLFFLFNDSGYSSKLILAFLAAMGVLCSLAGLTSYISTKRRSSYFIAQAGFILFFPVGLIGNFGMRKLLRQFENGETGKPVSLRINPMLAGGVIFAVVLVAAALITQPVFFSSRNLENMIRRIPLFVLYSFGVLLLARQDEMDFSIPAFAAATSILFYRAMELGSFSGAFLFIQTLGLILFIAFIYSMTRCLSGIPTMLISFAGLLAAYGLSLNLSRGTMIQIGQDAFSGIPAMGLLFVVIGGILVFILMNITAKRYENGAARGSCSLLVTWIAFTGAGVLGLMRGIYFGKFQGGIRPTLPLAEILFLLFAFLFLRAFQARTLSKPGILLAFIPPVLWIMLENLMSLGNMSADVLFIIKAYPILFVAVLSYFVRESGKVQLPAAESPIERSPVEESPVEE